MFTAAVKIILIHTPIILDFYLTVNYLVPIIMNMKSDLLVFAEEKGGEIPLNSQRWKILVVDDEESVHAVTRIALADWTFRNRGLHLLHAHDSRSCRHILEDNSDIALVLLDVVMDENDSGLQLVRFIREELQNHLVRIILRTGQPGQAPPEEVIRQYDINDYKEKTELTAIKLRTMVTTALRSYADLVELNRQRADLQRVQLYQERIMDAFPSVILTVDHELRLRHWNKRAARLFDLRHPESAGRIIFDIVPPAENFADDLLDVVERGRSLHLRETEVYFDRPRVVDLDVYPVETEGEELLGAVIRVEDVARLKAQNAQVRRAQKMEAVGSLMAGLAHDINNVLSAITGSASLLNLEAREDLDEASRENLDIISDSVDSAAGIVQQLMNLTRPREARYAPMNLITVIHRIMRLLRTSADKSVKIHEEVPQGRAAVKGDPSQIEQILLNLCLNGIQAMTVMREEKEPQGGTLTVSLHAEEPAPSRVGNWVVTVKDTGVGMNKITRNKIFEPFFSTKQGEGGTGLGLSMVKKIVAEHGGEITVDSHIDKGSLFSVRLPMTEAPLLPEAPSPLEEGFVPGKGRLLLCDDEKLMRRVGRRLLEKCGYQVVTARDGREALDIFHREKSCIDGVILDVMMPEYSGIEVFRKMQEMQPDVKAILATGFGEFDRLDEALAAGVLGYLPKPFNLKQLSAVVSTALNVSPAPAPGE